MIEIHTIINGGLPVIARGVVRSAGRDVGLMGPWVDEIEIFFRPPIRHPFHNATGGRYRGILDDDDEQRIVDELVSAYNEPPDYD